MKSILLSFANLRENPLPSLSKEDDSVYQSLLTQKPAELLLLRESFINTKKLTDCLIARRKDLWLLHYGGHADGRGLDLEDKKAHAEGIAQLLAHCKSLKVVVLNGCATQGQVQGILDSGVPVVIATSASVGDTRAARFAEVFYQALGAGSSVGTSFTLAKGAVDLESSDISWFRGFVRDRAGVKKDKATWGLFVQEGKEGVLDERLPGVKVPGIYFSHAWSTKETESEKHPAEIVDKLYHALQADKFRVLRDDMDLEYGGLISEFMQSLGAGEVILVFISDSYIRSPYCMFELYEIARNNKWAKKAFSQRVLPIRVESLKLDDPMVLDSYFEYWEAEESKWAKFIQKRLGTIGPTQMERYNKIREINQQFGKLADWLMDIHAASLELISSDDFALVKKAINERLALGGNE